MVAKVGYTKIKKVIRHEDNGGVRDSIISRKIPSIGLYYYQFTFAHQLKKYHVAMYTKTFGQIMAHVS